MSEPSHIHVDAPQRGFGLGFGKHHRVVGYSEEGPHTGPLLTAAEHQAIQQWANHSADLRPVGDVIGAEALAKGLANRLPHLSTLALESLLPGLLNGFENVIG